MIIINFLGSMFYYISISCFMIIYSGICFIVWIVATPFDRERKISHKMNCLVGYMIMFLNPFWRVSIKGLENIDRKQTYIFAPNHQSLTDIAILSSLGLQLKWISKKELVYIPFLGWIMAMAKYVLLDRKNPKSQINMMKSCERLLNNKISIAIFPEGTRSITGELGRFRDGASLLSRKTGTKILPICMYGNNESSPQKKFIWTKKVHMTMHALPAIDPVDYDKTKVLSNAIKDVIQEKQKECKATTI